MNIATRIFELAKTQPHKVAIIDARNDQTLTFLELEQKIEKICGLLKESGFQKGERTLLFVRPSLSFHALVFALFRYGVVPVLIDPGMGRKNLLKAIAHTKPTGMLAESIVYAFSFFFRKTFKSVKHKLSSPEIERKLQHSKPLQEMAEVSPEDMAAILFTSGGTGRPKGVIYTHHIFSRQTDLLQDMFKLTSEDVDLAGFPLFSLFTLAMGMTTIIPDMDPSKPGQCDPTKLSAHIKKYQATFVAGSPAIWSRVGDFASRAEIQFPSVKHVVMFGAPIRSDVHELLLACAPNGNTYAPYGATEALPLCLSDGRWLLKHTKELTHNGAGVCIGKPLPSIEMKIIKITDEAIAQFDSSLLCDVGEIGEIVVKGDTVTKEYDHMPEATKLAKIQDGAGFWHRMGDLGYIDENGAIWFCGRKAHRVQTDKELYTPIQVEAIFNQHPKVKRSALIGQSQKVPSIVVELKTPQKQSPQLICELQNLAKSHPKTSAISLIFFDKSFPVDVRHNIKIDRQKLDKKYLKQPSLI